MLALRFLPVFALIAHLTACSSPGPGRNIPSEDIPVAPSSGPPRDPATPSLPAPDAGPSHEGFLEGYMLQSDTPPVDAFAGPLYRADEIVLPQSWSFTCPASSVADLRGSELNPSTWYAEGYSDASCDAGSTLFVSACAASGSFVAVRADLGGPDHTPLPAKLVSDPVGALTSARFYAVGINVSGPSAAVGATPCLVANGDQACPADFPMNVRLAAVDDSRGGSCSTTTAHAVLLDVYSTNDCSTAAFTIPLENGRCTALASTNIRGDDVGVRQTTTVDPTVSATTGGFGKSYFTGCCRAD